MKIDLSPIGVKNEAPDSIALLYQFREVLPKTKQDLDSYLRIYYGIYLASEPIDDGNSSPLDFVWHLFSVAMDLKNDIKLEDYNVLGMSARNSQKSLSCAAFELLALTFDKDRNYFHMASILEQSRVTYGYVQGVLGKAIMGGVVKKSIMKETASRHSKVLKIGTGTIKNVNCVAGDQLVHTLNGYYTIDELFDEKKEIGRTIVYGSITNPTYLKDKLNFTAINNITYQGKAAIKIVELENGTQLKLTDNHNCKVVVKYKDGELLTEKRAVKDLKVGDIFIQGIQSEYTGYIKYFHGLQCKDVYKDIKVPKFLNENISNLLGMLIGNGGLSIDINNKETTGRGARITFTDDDEDILNKYKFILKQEFDFDRFHETSSSKATNIVISCTSLKRFLNALGLENVKSIYKRIPFEILRTTVCNQWAFISGYFNTDGCLRIRSINNSQSVEIIFYSSSRMLLQDLQAVLLQLNVGSNIRRVKRKKNISTGDAYYLNITFGKDIFMNNVICDCSKTSTKGSVFNKAKHIIETSTSLVQRVLPKELFNLKNNPIASKFSFFKNMHLQKVSSITDGGEQYVYDLFSKEKGEISIYNTLIYNSFHGSVIADEVDLTDRKVFVESKGMLAPGANGKGALDVKISSRKYAFGNIQSLLNEKIKNPKYPLVIMKWGQLEVTEKCKINRSITEEKTVPIYVDEERLLAISEQDYYLIKDIGTRQKYQKFMGFPGCLSCGIFSFCKTNLKKQTEDNPYLVPIDEVRRLFFTDDVEFFKSQRLNRKPSQSGLIFGQWDPFKHCLNCEQIYEIFKGVPYKGEEDLSVKELIEIMIEAGCKAYIGVDYGFNVAVAVLILKDGSDRFYVLDQVLAETMSDASFARMAWDRWKNIPIIRGYGDVASPGGIQEFAQYFPMLETILSGKTDSAYKEYSKLSKIYDYKFGLLRKLIASPGKNIATIFCHNAVTEVTDQMGIYRYYVDPRTDTVMSQPADGQRDHGCFAANTKVETIEGSKNIQDIKVGDLVLTRKGYKKVIDWACTGVKEIWQAKFSNGTIIYATPDHPFILNNDKIRLDALKYGDILQVCKKKQLFSKESHSEGTPIPKEWKIENILKQAEIISKKVLKVYIEKYGKIALVRFRKVFTSITKTVISVITKSKIWNVFPLLSIRRYMEKKRYVPKRFLNIWKELDLLAKNGIPLQKELNGTDRMPKKTTLGILKKLHLYVSSAINLLCQEMGKSQDIALIDATLELDGKADSITKLEYVKSVIKTSRSINFIEQNVVQENAVQFLSATPSHIDKVYNITVEEEHEYYANGILVSNCDALLHGLVGILVAGGGATKMIIAESSMGGQENHSKNSATPDDIAALQDIVLTGGYEKTPVRSGAIDPYTGIPIEEEEAPPREKDPRGNKKFRFTFT